MKKTKVLLFNLTTLLLLVLSSSCYIETSFKANFKVDDVTYHTSLIYEDGTFDLPQEPTKEGFNFVGWYYENEPERKFEVGDEVDISVTLYAKWESARIFYNIFYNLNGGTASYYTPKFYASDLLPLRIPTPIKTSYLFKGWTINGSNKFIEIITVEDITGGDITLTAHWEMDENYYTPFLEFTLINNNTEYSVSGGSTDRNDKINIPKYYNSLPVTAIAEKGFLGNSNLVDIVIPETVTKIGKRAFADCINLESVVIPMGVKVIETQVFDECDSLTNIVIPEGVTTLGDGAFSRCNSLINIKIPESVMTIGDFAFRGNTSLASLLIPKKVVEIGFGITYGCNSLTSIKVDSDNTSYDSRNNSNAIIETATNALIAGCQNTTIPPNILSINKYSFGGFINLLSIEIPEGITAIGDNAFMACGNLASIKIPLSVTVIGLSVFAQCDKLIIYCIAPSKPDGWDEYWNQANHPVVWGYED